MDLAQLVYDKYYRDSITEHDLIGDIIQACDVGAYFLGQDTYRIYHAIGAVFQPETILEIGVRFGYSLKSIIKGSTRARIVYGFDNEYDHKGSLEIARSNLNQIIDVRLTNADTQKCDRLDVEDKVDLAHIDGWHTEEGCYHDCLLVKPLMKNGGIIVVDDAGGEVRDGANRFCKEHGLTPFYLPCFTNMYLIQI